MAQFLQTGLGFGPLLGWGALLLAAPLAGSMVSRIGERPLIAAGPTLCAAGLGWTVLTARTGLPGPFSDACPLAPTCRSEVYFVYISERLQ